MISLCFEVLLITLLEGLYGEGHHDGMALSSIKWGEEGKWVGLDAPILTMSCYLV